MSSQSTTITKKVAKLSSAFDVDRYRTLVPALNTNDIIYLNASCRAPMNLKVRQALDDYLDEAVYQPDPKPDWQALTEETRALVGRYINAPPESIAFTSDTTGGLNIFQRSLKLDKGDNIVILDTEHPNHAYGWLALRETGLEVRQVSTNGQLYADAATFASLVNENTKAIGISSIMFHSGQKNNVQDICNHFRPRGVHVLVDMTQEVVVGPVSVTKNGVSAACFSFHKALGCPTGLGALYIDPKILNQLKQTPPIVGAGAIANLAPSLIASSGITEYHQTTRRYEHLSLSIVSIQAAHAALTLLMDDMTPEAVEGHLQSLGKKLQEEC
ncbi:pyridoxal phosphate-dependent transferase [Delphinella strobiligena]|nr:pyridoxal phosphate-dependent transferase [Delphinella strobiligena]